MPVPFGSARFKAAVGRRLQTYTAVLGFLLVLSIVAVSAGSMWAVRAHEEGSWRRELGNVSLQLAEQTALEVSSGYLILDRVADAVAKAGVETPDALRREMGTAAVFRELREQLRMLPQVDVVSIVDAGGRMVNFTRSYPAPPINLADRDYFERQSRGQGDASFISQPVRNKGNGRWTFYISRRLASPQGRFLGVAQVGFSTDFLADYYGKIALGAGASVTLYRDDFTVLARWPANDAMMGRRNVTGTTYHVIRELGLDSGVHMVDTPRMADGNRRVRRLGAVRRLARFPLIVNVTVTEDVVQDQWRGARRLLLGVAACCAAAVGLAFFLLWWSLRQRERNLASMGALKAQAEAASAAKSRFLAMMSHEIRTPLTAIIGYAELLGTEDDRARRREASGIVVRNGNHLLGLINDMLDISKVEAGRIDIEAVPFAPLDVLAGVQALMRCQAAAKGIDLRLEVAEPFPAQLNGDPTRWRQVLFNLVSNAVKFTERGGVTVIARYEHETATLRTLVADTGIGMSADELARLFEPFAQAGAGVGRRFGGTGLGLYLAQRLARGMGGDITVRSAPGEGSVFEAWVHAQPASATAPPAAGVAPVPDCSLQGTVLLAEDGPDNRALVAARLARIGLRCVAVEDGAQAVRVALASGVDLVLMDMQMPIMDGVDATRALRAAGFAQPIVALTANVMAEDVRRYRAAGCDEVVPKPIDFDRLAQLLARMLRAAPPPPLSDAGSDPALARMFAEVMAARVADLVRAIRADDRAGAAAICHKIKGAAGSFSHPALTDLARALEDALARADLGAAAALEARIVRYAAGLAQPDLYTTEKEQ